MNKIKRIIYVILLILIITAITYYLKNIEYFRNASFIDDIYIIRPPNEIAKYYDPNDLNPVKVMKSQFLNFPIEGFTMKDIIMDHLGFEKPSSKSVNIDASSLQPHPQPPASTPQPALNSNNNNNNNNNKLTLRYFDNEKCGDGYSPTGAKISSPSGLVCNDTLSSYQPVINIKTAKATAEIKDGSITKINITDRGQGYKKPKVVIEGTAVAEAIEANGEIIYIEMINKGSGYNEPPKIKIINEDENNNNDINKINKTCYLCIKDINSI